MQQPENQRATRAKFPGAPSQIATSSEQLPQPGSWHGVHEPAASLKLKPVRQEMHLSVLAGPSHCSHGEE